MNVLHLNTTFYKYARWAAGTCGACAEYDNISMPRWLAECLGLVKRGVRQSSRGVCEGGG